MRDLTLILPYYRNAGMLQEQQAIWRTYAPELKAHLHVIVVDDGSPKFQAQRYVEPTGIASFRLFRTLIDVRWNWLFCRNLGVAKATTEWVLLTDIDHALPAETLAGILSAELDPRAAYRLARVDAPHPWPYAIADCPAREDKRFHPNTWLLTRALYDAAGGYDERLSGCYGTDGEFRDRIQAKAMAVILRSDWQLVRYGREVLPDASTVGLTRKGDPANDADLRTRREVRARQALWRPLRLTFPYAAVELPEAVTC